MKSKTQQVYFILICAGFFLLAFFLCLKPWVYAGAGMEITTAEQLYKSEGYKAYVTAELYPTGFTEVNKNGKIKTYFYSIIIENRIVVVPLRKVAAEGQSLYIKGIVKSIWKNKSMTVFMKMVDEKYEYSPVGVSVPAHMSDYYIDSYYTGITVFIFIVGILSITSFAAGFTMRVKFKKSAADKLLTPSAIQIDEKSNMEESLIRECIYSDGFIVMSKKYLKYGKNDEIIKLTQIESFKLINNELTISLKSGRSIVIPAVDENQMKSIQKLNDALLIYMPEITGTQET